MPTVVAEHLTTCMVVIVFCRGFSHAVDCACRCACVAVHDYRHLGLVCL